uniref:DUF4283 domain-containing protein n=1 Tax=Tanacetum cinerariifolium TaxID=118510 RepID=A0A699H188_TANCI|nr:hypothetical protein [Tanacetum cinerariifolium]
MERGFLSSGDKKKKKKKKKEGVSTTPNDVYPIIDGIPKHVTNIDGMINLPKSILRKAVRNVVNDKHEVVKPAKDGGSASKVLFEAVGISNAKPASPMAFASVNSPKTGCSFASVLRPNDTSNKVHFRTLVNEEIVKAVDCVLPKAATAKVKGRYENSIVGFFLGKDPSFPVVQQYVSNTWRKFGFKRITRNDDGVYLFKFATKSGRDQVIEKGPWMIRKSPIILSKWSPSVSLKRGEVTKVLVWVKMYNVPVLAYSEDGLSLLGTQIEEEGDGYIKEVVRVEYDWKPPHCVDCKSFGHDTSLCPKRVREEVPQNLARDTKTTVMEENDDGFTEVKSRKKNKGANFGVSNLDLNTFNPFDVLNVDGEDMGESRTQPKVSEYVNSDLNENRMEASKTSSSKSVCGDDHKDKNISSPTLLKKWDVINEDDTTDDEDVFTSYGGYVGGGNQLEDEDFDF